MWIYTVIVHTLFAKRKNNTALLLSIASIAVGVFSLIAVIGIMNGLQKILIDDLVAIESYEYSGSVSAPLTLSDITHTSQALQAISGVTTVVPFVDELAIAKIGKKSAILHVRAIDDIAAQRDIPFISAIAPQLAVSDAGAESPSRFISPHTIQLGWYFATTYGAMVGDVITLVLPGEGAGFAPVTADFIVSDVFYTNSQYDTNWAFISLDDFAGINANATQSTNTVASTATLSNVHFGIRGNNTTAILTQSGTMLDTVRTWQENNRSFYFALKTEKTLITMLTAIIFGVIVLHFRFSMVRRIHSKRDDIVALRTMGATPWHINLWFLGESICVGMLGILIGTGAGVAFLKMYAPIFAFLKTITGLSIQLESSSIGFVTLHEVKNIMLFTILLILFTAYLTLKKVTKIIPLQVLRYE